MTTTSVPRLSVALPVRNAGPWLRECLDSVLAQTESRFELVAVDDGSTDTSSAILADYARRDARIHLHETTVDQRGIVAALNIALAAARAPYLARMDADDRMHPERLARQADALDSDASLFGVTCRATAFPAAEVRDGMRAYLEWQNSLATPEVENADLDGSQVRARRQRRSVGAEQRGPCFGGVGLETQELVLRCSELERDRVVDLRDVARQCVVDRCTDSRSQQPSVVGGIRGRTAGQQFVARNPQPRQVAGPGRETQWHAGRVRQLAAVPLDIRECLQTAVAVQPETVARR